MNLRDPAKMASNALCIAKMYLLRVQKEGMPEGDIEITTEQELEWRPKGKEWNPLDFYLRQLIRVCNLKSQAHDKFKEKEELALVLTGLVINYKILANVFVDDEGRVVALTFKDQTKKDKIIHKLIVYK